MEYTVLLELKELYSKEQFAVACDFLRIQLEDEDHEPVIGHATLEQVNSLLED
tara:strand:- start:45 stop:203 length:159 start_codon:yes stop_codon:yes gene_type:complete